MELKKRKVGVTGLAAAEKSPLLYVASATTIFKVSFDGAITALVNKPELVDCDSNPPPDGLPGFRGLAVTPNEIIYAAASGCRTVLKISPNGKVETLLKSDRPWAPTDVAFHAGDIYILEWTNPNHGPDLGWRPRVRKVSSQGTMSTLVTIEEDFKGKR